VTRVRVVSLRSFDPLIAGLSPKAYRAWGRSLEWSCFHGRDGMLTPEDLRIIGASPGATQELLQSGVWKLDEQGRTFVAELREGPVVAEVEGCEVEHASLPMTPAERARRYRERKRNTSSRDSSRRRDGKRDAEVTVSVTESDAERDVSVTGGLTGGPNPFLSGSSLNPESSLALSSPSDLTGSARVSRKNPKTPLPPGWEPKQKHVEKASERRLNFPLEVERFKADADKNSRRYANWDRAFDSWLISPYAKPESGPGNGSRPTRAGDLTEALFERAARLRAEEKAI
jgi:hypothetical protein